jgi:hypothetical protein
MSYFHNLKIPNFMVFGHHVILFFKLSCENYAVLFKIHPVKTFLNVGGGGDMCLGITGQGILTQWHRFAVHA